MLEAVEARVDEPEPLRAQMCAMSRPFRFGAQIDDAGSAAEWAAKVRQLEDTGYSTVLMPDHFGEQLAPMPALTAAAAATTTLRVGALVFNNDYKHPLVLAKECATLDLLSNGRLEVGIGAGWLNADYEQSGTAQDPASVRVERMAEGISVIKGVLSAERFSFGGKHYRITDHTGYPTPVQKPHPPILIGGGGRRVLTIAGRHADIVSVNFAMIGGAITTESLLTGTAAATQQKLDWVRDAAGSRFADIELSVTIFAAVVTDDANSADSTARRVAGRFGMSIEEAKQTPHALFGPVGSIVEEIQRRREEFGFSYVVLSGGSEGAMAPVVQRLAGT